LTSESIRKTGHSSQPSGQHRIRPSLPGALGTSLIFILAVAFSAGAAATEAETDAVQYRTALNQLFDTAGEILFIADPNSAGALDDAIGRLRQISDEELQTFFMQPVPLEELQEHLQALGPQLSAVRSLDEMDTIGIPTVTVDPPECESATPGLALGAQTVATVFEVILGAQKYICLQEVLGENFAGICAVFDIARVTANSVAQGENYCLAQKNLARNKAMLNLTRGIGDHLNTFVDDVTLSSRASQDALDSAQNSFDHIQTESHDIQATLDSGYSQLDAQSTALMGAITDLGNEVNSLAALLDDINFRSTISLAFLEDASLRVADLQERAFDIQSDVNTITAMLGDIYSAGSQLDDVLEIEWTRQQLDRIAADLGNPEANNPVHALPASAGGELELAREIVINTIFSLQALGSVDTSQALALVGTADASYNAGQYPKAYLALKQAYQSLDGLTEGR